MSKKFTIKRGDTSPALKYQLNLSEGQTLVGASARFKMRVIDGTVKKVDAVAVVDAVENTLTYQWMAADTDTAGQYIAEFEVTYSDNRPETFPNNGFIEVTVHEDLD